jgi:hypothetical protein
VTSSNRAEWQNFVGAPDIQPLGRAYGYQLELPFETPALFSQRVGRFFDDPRNIRGLFGDISLDAAGRTRPVSEAIQQGIEVKRGIRNTPKLMQDLSRLMDTPNSGAFGLMAGLEDAYSVRQLFGEAPGEYGDPNPSTPSTERRGTDTSTGTRARVGTGEPTSELSPAERTAATSASFRPSVLARDLAILGSTEAVVPSYPPGTALTGLDAPAPLRALDVLNRGVSGFAGEAFDEPIQIDATRNYDNEWLRNQVTRDQFGTLQIANEFPGEFAENLQSLLRERGADPDYIYDSLRESGVLPSESRAPDVDWDDDGNSGAYEGPRTDESALRRFVSDYPEQLDVLSGRSGSGLRVSKTDLLNEYGRYLPVGYKKLSMGDIQDFQSYFNNLRDPNAAEISRSFARDVVNLGPVRAIELAFSGVTGKIQNKDKQYKAADYLGKYLEALDDKMTEVPVRSAGVGGGEYLSSMDLENIYPAAARKLESFSRDRAFVPEYFEPTISETFYSNSGVPYRVEINRDPAHSGLELRDINENVAALLDKKPYAGVYNIDFSINGNYSDVGLPDELKQDVMNFVKARAREGIPAGAVVRNAPMTNEGSRVRGSKGNKRSLWYQQLGFGANTPSGQFGYIDPDTGATVPIQPYRSDPFSQGPDTYKRSYFSVDPVSAAAQGAREYGRALRRTPAALLPGAADLIPSPEAIQTGYREGLLPMAQQMGTEFVQSLPQAAAYSAALAAVPVLAPGVGAGMVGTAGAKALNEVVRQETGEGIVPKLRQALGTAPRTGVASPARTGPQPLTAQVRPLTQAQRTEQQRQQNRSELQRRLELAGQRWNPGKFEFGLSELLRGR